MTAPRIRLERLIFSDGSSVDLEAGQTLLLVGPNNVGKSRAIRDIVAVLQSASTRGQVITEVRWRREGSVLDIAQRDEPEASRGWDESLATLGVGNLAASTAEAIWRAGSLGSLLAPFLYHASTEARLMSSTPQELGDLLTSRRRRTSLQKLYADSAAEDRLSEISKAAFNEGLILDSWTGGTQVLLRMGEVERPSTPRPDADYLRRVSALPGLHTQGDGIRSFIGMVLEILTGNHDVVMIDEPEVFLHPPQARQVGRLIPALSGQEERQTILATHSSDVIRGALESDKPVTVVRLTRENDLNTASVVDRSSISKLWSDPLLRSSNALDALFSHAAVLCESDSDCRYFSSVLDNLGGDDSRAGLDLHFVGCNGKDRLSVVASALHAAKVPIRMILDFDALDQWSRVESLCASVGVDSRPLKKAWTVVNASLATGPQSWSRSEVESVATAAIARISTERFTQRQLNAIRDRLKIPSKWSEAKVHGLGAFKGEVFAAASGLLAELKEVGIYIIPVGEVECIVRAVSGHGSEWVATVIERGLHRTEASSEAANLMTEIVASLS